MSLQKRIFKFEDVSYFGDCPTGSNRNFCHSTSSWKRQCIMGNSYSQLQLQISYYRILASSCGSAKPAWDLNVSALHGSCCLLYNIPVMIGSRRGSEPFIAGTSELPCVASTERGYSRTVSTSTCDCPSIESQSWLFSLGKDSTDRIGDAFWRVC